MSTRFDFLPANTNYSVNICAMTRRQECGQKALGSCKMRSMPPKMDQLRRSFQWINDRRLEKDIFRLRTAKFSQRNGPICCIRVVMGKFIENRISRQFLKTGIPDNSEKCLKFL